MAKNHSASKKLEDNAIWNEANDLAEYMYARAGELPEFEEWRTVSKLKNSTVDFLFYAAQAIGGVSPATTAFEWATARKHVVALRTIYLFACKQQFIELEPAIVVRLDNVIKQVDEELDKEAAKIESLNEEDLKPWLKKYEIWKKISGETT
jgi:hypothetical protein